MTCGLGVAIIGLMLVIGFGLLLIGLRRNESAGDYRGHVPPWPMPETKDLPPPPPKKKD